MPKLVTPDDPRIELIRRTFLADPKLTPRMARELFNVSQRTLAKWELEGLIPTLFRAPCGRRSILRKRLARRAQLAARASS